MRKPVLPYANNKGADQPANPRSLISTFVIRCLDSIIPLVSISEIPCLYIASVAAQTGLSLPWSQTLKTGFLVTGLIQGGHVTQLCPFPFSCPSCQAHPIGASSRENLSSGCSTR